MESVSAERAAEMLGCSLSTVYNLYRCGELKGFEIGPSYSKKRRKRIYLSGIEEYQRRNENAPLDSVVRQPDINMPIRTMRKRLFLQ